ncbi:MAG TPA: PQQ-binding-like beta-propeller repeat protein [Gemmataceae bacterium]|nr:PQQ-binding-like beta-propeller repeat protein [Gemmataceae bacterium]
MRRILMLFVMLLFTGLSAAGENWPQFRGPHGDNRADDAKLPLTWSENKNVVWKTAIHDKGWSSPVVWGDQIWLTTAKADGKELFAVCVDRDSGKVRHDVKVFDVENPSKLWAGYNSFASPTPAIEASRVYVHFGTYGTACLDTATGKTLWQRLDLHCDHWRGAASSPILYGDLLFLTFDGHDKQYVVALNKHSGDTVWQKDRDIDYKTTDGDFKKAFSTPAIRIVDGVPQLISSAAMATIAYDPKTGAELWKVYHGGMNVTAPPLYGQGKAFLCTGDGGLRLLAVRPNGRGDITATHIAWKAKNKNSVPSRSSPILVGDLLYMVHESGMVSCLEAETGELVWQERLGGKFWASPLYANGRLYFFDEDGQGHVLAAGRTWKKLATNKLNDGCRASPAVSGKALFVRTLTHLYRIEERD